MSEVTVSADDVRVVSDVLVVAARAFGSYLGNVPGFGAALEASARMAVAAERSAMPEDPVSSTKSMAIAYNEMLRAFMDSGFDESQAFRLLEIQASAAAQLGLAKALHG